MSAAKDTWQLFGSVGWEAIINDDLTSMALTMGIVLVRMLLICVNWPARARDVVFVVVKLHCVLASRELCIARCKR